MKRSWIGPMALLLLFSCSQNQTTTQDPANSSDKVTISSLPTKEEAKQMTGNRRHTTVARIQAHEQKDTSRIVGSAAIKKPLNHETRTYYLHGAEHLKLDNYYFDIPVVYNPAVKKWINFFLNRGRGFFERYSARAGRYAPLLGKILSENGLPRDLIFLAMAESGFTNTAKSWARAVGPWQFMPYTGRRFGLKIDWYVDERRDPIKATIAASLYLKKLYQEFGAWELAAAAYNAGEGKVSRAIRRYRTENFWKLSKGRYLKRETKNYVPKIMALAIIGKNLRSFGFEDIDFHEPLDFDEIDVPAGTDLMKLAKDMKLDFEEVQYLNPEILRWFTPINGGNYKLRVPVGEAKTFAECCQELNYKATEFMTYKVRGRRTQLKDVAKKFKIKSKTVLTDLNGISANARLKRGALVSLPFKSGQSVRAPMYADLYERPRRSIRRRRKYRSRIKRAITRGKRIKAPKEYYTVRRGDSLWTVSRKFNVSVDTLIASNLKIIKRRMIRAGDRLVVR